MNEYKNIHIGNEIKNLIDLKKIGPEKICSQLNMSHIQLEQVYKQKQLEVPELMKWCKILNFDLFRLYSTHLQIYFPSSSGVNVSTGENMVNKKSKYQFRKRLYTPEMISFILKQMNEGKMTTSQIIRTYSIPKTTLYRWIKKDHKNIEFKKKREPKPILIESYEILLKDILNSKKEEIEPNDYDEILKSIGSIKSYKDVEKINNSIFSNQNEDSNYQRIKAFDKDKIDTILKDKLENNLNNCEISRKYNISRNTIAKWLKLFA